MHAALVTAFDQAPTYAEVAEPEPVGPHDVVVEVLAAGLHPRVRSQASGSHYTSGEALPLVPGIDGVGRDPEGTLRYFVLPDSALGSMAERTVVDVRRSVALPPDADPVTLAAAMNPAMSSWVALRRRTDFRPGQSVLVLGAGGNAGRLALEVARHLGAGEVVGVGRDTSRLAEQGRRVDVVLDYLWGQPTADALRAVVPARADDDQPLTWVQVGSVAGLESPIPSAALRATRLAIVGSGQGSVPTRAIVEELEELARVVAGFDVDALPVPLADVEAAWSRPSSHRVVLVP